MKTNIDEVADHIYRLSTCVPEAALSPVTGKTIRRLATLEPQALALMHGSSTRARCRQFLLELAYDRMTQSA